MTSNRSQTTHQVDVISTLRMAAENDSLKELRDVLARFTAGTFADAGENLYKFATIPSDTNSGIAVNEASDEATTISILLQISSQLVSASADLFSDGRNYAAAALLRQMVEVEYLAWAVDVRDQDAKRWLRSDKKQRMTFFSPAKLRKASKGKFRSQDYSFHCEFGGHPTPAGAVMLLKKNQTEVQILIADLLGHAGRTWDHMVRWAMRSSHGGPILEHSQQMLDRFSEWKSQDPLAKLPPPPELHP